MAIAFCYKTNETLRKFKELFSIRKIKGTWKVSKTPSGTNILNFEIRKSFLKKKDTVFSNEKEPF